MPAEADPWKRKFDQLMSEGDAAPEGDGAAESSPGGTSVTPLPPSEAEFLAELERSVQFTFAKTYAETYPHEYTTRRACPLEWHARLIALIEKHGVAERFYREERNYLYFGERKYWHMGRPYSQRPEGWPNVINRTLEVGRYADQARARGYEGEELEKLVRRWEALLRKARGE